MPALVHSTSSLEKDVRDFLRSANQFYGLAREPARRERSSGDCGLNLYTRFEDFMNHPRYHVSALCNTIEEQIEDVDGEETHKVRTHIEKIRALLRISEPELHELDHEDEPDEDVEEEEPIYFTTWEDIGWSPGYERREQERLDKEFAEKLARETMQHSPREHRERSIVSWPSIPNSPPSQRNSPGPMPKQKTPPPTNPD